MRIQDMVKQQAFYCCFCEKPAEVIYKGITCCKTCQKDKVRTGEL